MKRPDEEIENLSIPREYFDFALPERIKVKKYIDHLEAGNEQLVKLNKGQRKRILMLLQKNMILQTDKRNLEEKLSNLRDTDWIAIAHSTAEFNDARSHENYDHGDGCNPELCPPLPYLKEKAYDLIRKELKK